MKKTKAPAEKKKVALALQGGGSLGAFTWGVLEAFLRDPRLEITGFSGTSAGAMNILAVIQGMINNKNEGAIQSLKDFWHGASKVALGTTPALYDPIGNLTGEPNLKTSPMFLNPLFGYMYNYLSPYMRNPFDINYFRNFCEGFFDFASIRKTSSPKIFLTATHVETGKIKVFKNEDIDLDVTMATGCIPRIFHAVSVKGEHYWDGGFVANPAIYPLIYDNSAKDIVIIQLTKNVDPNLPKTSASIKHRFNEITLTSSLMREIRAIHLITRLIDEGKIVDKKMSRINLHIIKDEHLFSGFTAGAMMNMNIEFLEKLHAAGIKAGQKWIHSHYDSLGKKMPFRDSVYRDYIEDIMPPEM